MDSVGDSVEAAARRNGPSVLRVERSLTGQRWVLPFVDEGMAAALSQRFALPEFVGRVLAGRGIGLAEAEAFLAPTLRHLLPDPCVMKDMRPGAERVVAAVVAGETIAVFGDYDVDGATAAALLLRFLRAVGAAPALLYVPDRLREGYGPNARALLDLRGRGATLAVTVDCGIAAHAPLAAAAEAGLDVVVVDHHLAPATLPPAAAVINPNRRDESGALGHLAAVGVAFLLVVDVNRLLREAGWYRSRPEPDLRRWLDLVALGTVCDVVPLAGLNRAFVAQGLRIMAARDNPGLRAMAEVAGIGSPVSARDLGFAIGPRINAGGRVGRSDLGARLLATEDPAEAAGLARQLDALNRERREIEQDVLNQAMAGLAAGRGDGDGRVVWAVGDGWHPGVIGVVASRLAERYHRPAIVAGRDGERVTASGRSVPGIDLGVAVNAAVQAGLLVKGGGHAMAAGFTAESRRLGEVLEFLAGRLATDGAGTEAVRPLAVDAEVTLAGAAALPAAALALLAPFGAGHPEPRFVLPAVRIANPRILGGSHVACTLADGAGARLSAIAFRCNDGPLGRGLTAQSGTPLHLAGRLQPRQGGGGALQLVIDDAATALASD